MSYARTLVTDMTQLTYVMRARRDERGAGRLCNSNGKSPFVTICTRYTIRIFTCNRGLAFVNFMKALTFVNFKNALAYIKKCECF